MLQGSNRKRLIALIIVLILVFAGCVKNHEETTETGTNAEIGTSTETGTNTETGKDAQTSQKVTEAASPTPTIEPAMTTNGRVKTNFKPVKPYVANWGTLKRKPAKLEDAAKWGDAYDFRLEDLSLLDLSEESESLKKIVFDTFTTWPDKLPKDFDPEALMETGKDPGLGIRSLHEKGITGKGVNIAIIDQMLLVQHQEYADQIKLYEQGNGVMEASMHGPFVASLAVGKDIGVAPDAGLYFIGTYNFNAAYRSMALDYTYYADAIDRLLEINLELPKEEKIRAISISTCWSPENKGYDEFNAAIERAKKEEIFVISCNMFENYGFWPYSLDKEPGADPDKEESYSIIEWERWIKMVAHLKGFTKYFEERFSKDFQGEFLLVPIGSRTYAEATGKDVYCFSRHGGWSAMEPYLAGLYAMACQVKPDITPELFWETALETGAFREVTKGEDQYPARMLNPVALIEKLQK